MIYNAQVLIDLTQDSVEPSVLADGYTAHDKSGALIVGTMKGGGEDIEPRLLAILGGV